MAVQTPSHAQGHGLSDDFHLIDAPVAGFAPDPGVHVAAVGKVDKVGSVVHPNPLDRHPGLEAMADEEEPLAVRLHLGVAVHAGGGGGDHGHRRPLGAHVAVAAVHAQVPGVNLMAVGNRLLRGVAHLGRPRRDVVGEGDSPGNEQDGETGRDRHRRPIRPLGEEHGREDPPIPDYNGRLCTHTKPRLMSGQTYPGKGRLRALIL
jgi:hypothetical protein